MGSSEPRNDVVLQLFGDLDDQFQLLSGDISCRIVAGCVSLVRKRPHLADELRVGADGKLQALDGSLVVAGLRLCPVTAGTERDGRRRERGTERGDEPEVRRDRLDFGISDAACDECQQAFDLVGARRLCRDPAVLCVAFQVHLHLRSGTPYLRSRLNSESDFLWRDLN